jgi:hypothetical protein
MTGDLWWITLSIRLIGSVAVLAAVALIVRRRSQDRPLVSRWLFAAISFQSLGLFSSVAQWADILWTDQQPLTLDDKLTLMNPAVLKSLAFQVFYAACSIVAWTCLAWAILWRPDDARRSEPASC